MNLEKIMLFAILTALLIYTIAFAEGGVYWQENGVLVVDSTFGGGSHPLDIVPDGYGGAVIVWEDARTLFGIACQRIDSLGNLLWDEDGVFIDSLAFWLPHPEIISDGSGGAIVAWVGSGFTEINVHVQRIRYDGVPLWGYLGIHAGQSDSAQWNPAIIGDSTGGCIVTWLDERQGNLDIYAQRIDSTGSRLWGNTGLPVCTAMNDQGWHRMDNFMNDDIVILWSDMRNGDYDIYAQRIDENGNPLWPINGKEVYLGPGDQVSTKIIEDGRNGAIIVWEAGDFITYDFDIYAQRIDTNGTICWDSSGVVICNEDSLEFHSKIVSDSKGGIVAVWLDERTSHRWDVYCQRVDSNGICMWDSNGVFINTIADTSQEWTTLYPQICSDGRSGGIITWKDYRSNNNWDIYCQRIDSLGVLQWTVTGLPVCVNPEQQRWGPVICEDSRNGGIIAWGDKRYYASVFAQRVGDVAGVVQRKIPAQEREKEFQLICHPNPFKDIVSMRIGFLGGQKCRSQDISIGIYDVAGRSIVDHLPVSCHSPSAPVAYWDGKDLNGNMVHNGLYFAKLEFNNNTIIKKLIKF